MMTGIVGDPHHLAADQALAFLHFHFHYGKEATPHEYAVGGHVPAVIFNQPHSLEIRVANQRFPLS